MTDEAALVETFRDARRNATPWPRLAEALNRLETTRATDEHGRSWARVAAELSNYSVNQLRQMQRTLAALEQLHTKNSTFDLPSTLEMFPFSHLEIIARIAKLDPEAAVKYLKPAHGQHKASRYRELRDQYYILRDKTPRLTSPIAAGLKTSRQFEDLCLELLKANHASDLYESERSKPGALDVPERQITRWPGAFRYASPDLLIEVRSATTRAQVDAADCLTVYGDIGQDETVRHIRRIAFEASFFTTFWIMLPIWSPHWLFASECETLELFNVGVAAVDPQSRRISLVRAPQGSPKHDRRKLLYESLSTYLRFKRT